MCRLGVGGSAAPGATVGRGHKNPPGRVQNNTEAAENLSTESS